MTFLILILLELSEKEMNIAKSKIKYIIQDNSRNIYYKNNYEESIS